MATNTVKFDGLLWFFTDADSPKIAEIERDPRCCSPIRMRTSSTTSRSRDAPTVVQDAAKAKELWSEGLRVWFPERGGGPRIALIKVDVEIAEYWDSPSSTMVYAYGYVKAVTTGNGPTPAKTRR